MAYVKHTAIHTTPKAHLKYILNPEKNEKMKYVTGICCGDDLETAYDNFKEIFEKYNDENFDICETSLKSGKRNIRIHSYTQSFDSSVSPEKAHRIGVEWAKKVFGENRPIIVSTHSNTDHCHNHIAVCPYDLDGIRWHSNRKSLEFVRKRSDEICLEHGLDIIRNPRKKSTISYKEHDARKKGYSWKVKMADTIDRLIHSDDAEYFLRYFAPDYLSERLSGGTGGKRIVLHGLRYRVLEEYETVDFEIIASKGFSADDPWAVLCITCPESFKSSIGTSVIPAYLKIVSVREFSVNESMI